MSISDNEWGAGFVGKKIVSREVFGLCVATGAGLEKWRPDSNLNQFKLVLDKYDKWYAGLELYSEPWKRAFGVNDNLRGYAWNDPAKALKVIRASVEPDGPGKEAVCLCPPGTCAEDDARPGETVSSFLPCRKKWRAT